MLKRSCDLLVAIVALVLLSPLMAVIAVLVRLSMGPPVLFRQVRAGLHGQPFVMYKFRTMRVAVATAWDLDDDEPRLTALGRRLRATSLDELPELWNVIRGDMSLVGPRPLLPQYLDRYSARQARRHEVKPGVTGLAQVCGRNSLSWHGRLELDVQYVERRSNRLDLLLLARTVALVLSRRGISADGSATMPIFVGDAQDGPSDACGATIEGGRRDEDGSIA